MCFIFNSEIFFFIRKFFFDFFTQYKLKVIKLMKNKNAQIPPKTN
jgi:hypothetical protein